MVKHNKNKRWCRETKKWRVVKNLYKLKPGDIVKIWNEAHSDYVKDTDGMDCVRISTDNFAVDNYAFMEAIPLVSRARH